MKLEVINGKKYQILADNRLLTTDNKIVYLLEHCKACGTKSVVSHPDLSKLCDRCGKDWRNYQYQKTLFRKTTNNLTKYSEWVQFWYNRHQAGLLAPSDILEQKLIVDKHKAWEDVVTQQRKDAEPRIAVNCYRCGQDMYTARKVAKPVCHQCDTLYARYKSLRRKIAVLTVDECTELRRIIAEYIHAYKNDGWSPTSSDKLLEKLRRREHELGM